MESKDDFFSQYLTYTSGTEVPTRFNRWSAIAMIGAYLGRQCFIRHGHNQIFPNIYCLLIGNAGTRKSTPIKLAKRLLLSAGYTTIAAAKTTKEKFLMDLGKVGIASSAEDMLSTNLFGTDTGPAETFIMADEFNTFFGNNILEFVSELGTLWDYSGPYENRIKHGQSFTFTDPTISILGGNTAVSFNTAFPSEILGQGFFSRLLLIYGEPNGRKIAFPVPPSDESTNQIIKALQDTRKYCTGELQLANSARTLLELIYKNWTGVDDVRFESYSNRRFTHLLKLIIIHTAARYKNVVEEQDVIYANTVLDAAEQLMPKALGEFGKAKNSDVSQKIIAVLDATNKPLKLKELWKYISNDLEKMTDLGHILNNLLAADKIQNTTEGFLPKKKVISSIYNGVIYSGFLSKEERGEI